MLTFLRQLFGKPQTLPQLARSPDRDGFARRLGESDVFVIAAFDGDGLDPAAPQEQLLAAIEQAAKDLNERQDGFAPFVYESGGRRRLPFFSSNEHAQTFAAAYSSERNRVFPIQLLGVRGSVLARLLLACDELAMNDRSPDEVVLTEDQTRAIHEAWGEN